ncbi:MULTISPECIES: DHA2 family efflux MFS transporter permease subunit [unclassified Mycolicibacterium]|uniref:DHA2 family efflux MFS transporter permease subunit n=1 Tax=unclassified Mycolicibacterium TaxID=2636767 RepID=UPI0012DD7BC3|nr:MULTISPECIES: DHA2 family efflux MFS transporter permease subunit [unclassified Mycolicibacterium]MUL80931.1 multidrug efflux MFS transporter [Mycolicibacterium sp. CBMA 329]MUL86697.1 multidrug efflux MFS transporter [Mycolicibacterium sp. CBMA 331]MUM02900.1 multidrug efflux MFS transporter [Mycolicibacterium sp. CBMA 334]MUM28855.1 multidrug efflux MFS transporter [Mycolicibacterium sp. CBMA 295]MUM36994.1 multidrug efflux MFS transporter [Mycolicibacterium sp. CBMA 247]
MTTGPSTGEIATQPRAQSSANVIIGLLVGSAFVMILNETIMSVALPALIVDLDIAASTAQWLTSGFLLTMAVVIPMSGSLLQRYPVRGIYLASMALFCTGTLVAAMAPGFAVLLAGRIVQACGTAVMMPLLMTTVMTLIPAERRGQMMGTISIVIAVAPAIGPTLSGFILGSLDWRWMFWIVLPIALVALSAGLMWLRVDDERQEPTPIDPISVPLSAIAFAGLVFGLTLLGESADGRQGVPAWVPMVIGAVAMVLFGSRQVQLQRRDRAFLDLRPFTYRRFSVSLGLVVLGFMGLFGAIIMVPLYVQNVLGQSALVAGLTSLPGGLLMGVAGPLVGRAYDRHGARVLVVPGSMMLCVSLWGFTMLSATSPIWELVTLQTIMMVGLAMMFTPLMTDALGVLPDRLYSHGSAILTTLQQVGGAAGTALFVTVMTKASHSGGAPDFPGVHAAFTAAAVISVIAVVTAFFTAPRPSPAGGTPTH